MRGDFDKKAVGLPRNDTDAITNNVKKETSEVEFENIGPKVEIDTDISDICYAGIYTPKCEEPGSGTENNINKKNCISVSGVSATSAKEKLAEYKRKLGYPDSKTQCPACLKYFESKKFVRLHEAEVHGKKIYHCIPCDRWFSTNASFDDHLKVHLDIRPFKCKSCDKSFTAQKYLSSHLRIHTEESERKFSCSLCPKRFVRKKHLEAHTRMHTNERPFSCSDCGKTYKHEEQLRIHRRLHTGERFYCRHCNKGFTAKCDMEKHETVHSDVKGYKCDTCGSSFRAKGTLRTHVRVHADASQLDTQECSICGLVFRSKNYLKKHMEVHVQNRPSVTCNLCGTVFKRKSGLYSHRKYACKSLEYQDWRCDICGKCMKSEGTLRKHRKFHTHGYKYPCTQCDKSYPMNHLLTRHIKEIHMHVEKKGTKCKLCRRKIVNMESHLMQRHSKNRGLHQCATCGKVCLNEANLKHHENIHLATKPYRCDTCNRTYAQKVNMKRHIECMHLNRK